MGRVLRFPPFEFDAEAGRLSRDGRELPLRPKTLTLLRFLLDHPGRLLTREELTSAVWPDTHVSPALLKNRVRDLRQVLGADGDSWIETVPRRGYRLRGAVEVEDVGERLRCVVSILGPHSEGTSTLPPDRGGVGWQRGPDHRVWTFDSALAAVRCALDVFGARPPGAIRVGIHLGDVRLETGGPAGDAPRLADELARATRPGRLCLSDAVYRQVRAHLDLVYEPLATDVENERAYLVSSPDSELVASEQPGFGDRPAIAVLSFASSATEAEPRWLADGMVEDLVARLSRFRSFPVISRNSSQVYEGRHVSPRRIGEELGARYLLSGSVRSDDSRVRIATELVDAPSGRQLWSERFERRLEDLFALQDEIAEAITGAIHPELGRAELARIVHRDPANLGAWEWTHRGWHELFAADGDNATARAWFERAIELDPQFVSPNYGLAMSHYNDVIDQTTSSPARSVAGVARAARRCMTLDDQDPGSHIATGCHYTLTQRQEEAIASIETALDLNPSFSRAYYWLGFALALAGRSDEAIAALERGIRLSPRDPQLWVFFQLIALAHFGAGRLEEAERWSRRTIERRPDGPVGLCFLAATLSEMGRAGESRDAAREVLAAQPGFTLEAVRVLLSTAEASVRDRFLGGLRQAGIADA